MSLRPDKMASRAMVWKDLMYMAVPQFCCQHDILGVAWLHCSHEMWLP